MRTGPPPPSTWTSSTTDWRRYGAPGANDWADRGPERVGRGAGRSPSTTEEAQAQRHGSDPEPWVIAEQLRHSDGGTLVVQLYGHPDRKTAIERIRRADGDNVSGASGDSAPAVRVRSGESTGTGVTGKLAFTGLSAESKPI